MTSLPPVLHSNRGISETPPPLLCSALKILHNPLWDIPRIPLLVTCSPILTTRYLHNCEQNQWDHLIIPSSSNLGVVFGQSSPIQHLGRCGLFFSLVYETLCDLNLVASSPCLWASRDCRRSVRISVSSSEAISDRHSAQYPQRFPPPLAAVALTDPNFEQEFVEADSCLIRGFV